MQWEDITNYRRGGRDVPPQSLEGHAGDLRIFVTRHIHRPPDRWMLFTNWPALNEIELCSRDLVDAQTEALALVRTRLHEALAATGE